MWVGSLVCLSALFWLSWYHFFVYHDLYYYKNICLCLVILYLFENIYLCLFERYSYIVGKGWRENWSQGIWLEVKLQQISSPYLWICPATTAFDWTCCQSDLSVACNDCARDLVSLVCFPSALLLAAEDIGFAAAEVERSCSTDLICFRSLLKSFSVSNLKRQEFFRRGSRKPFQSLAQSILLRTISSTGLFRVALR